MKPYLHLLRRLRSLRSRTILLIIFINSITLFCRDNLPMWVQFENAKELFRTGQFQESLDFFLEVTKGNKPFPEAEYMIGLLYLEEGELQIAEKQIKKAIELSPYLQVQKDLIEYKYSLGQVYLLKEDYENYLITLKDIIGGDQLSLEDIRDQKAYFDVLINSGMDRFLHLYRVRADSVINARILLGYYYHNVGDYKNSVNYLLTPVLALISEVVEDNKSFDREYLFTDMDSFFKEVRDNKRALQYFEEHDFYKLFYYLGESLLGLDKRERALEVWTLLANSEIDSLWVEKSKKQILDPTLENWKLIY